MLGAVDAVRGEQFGGAQDGDVAEQLGADFVLSAVAAVVLQVDRAQAHAVAEHGEQRVGLVVGMRRSLQERAGNAQLANRQAERDVAAVLAHDRIVHAILRHDADGGDSKKDDEQTFHEAGILPESVRRQSGPEFTARKQARPGSLEYLL